ncbi:MAG: hypothetical protein J7559_12575 [Cohnella sp.]|nr:hypothetical protein [Cohnella sp.]
MKIKMKTLAAGPDGILQPNETYDVDQQKADDFVSGGYAEYVDEASESLSNLDDISIEQFGELGAGEQKNLLTKLKIDGDVGNEEKRSTLYANYLQSKAKKE